MVCGFPLVSDCLAYINLRYNPPRRGALVPGHMMRSIGEPEMRPQRAAHPIHLSPESGSFGRNVLEGKDTGD